MCSQEACSASKVCSKEACSASKEAAGVQARASERLEREPARFRDAVRPAIEAVRHLWLGRDAVRLIARLRWKTSLAMAWFSSSPDCIVKEQRNGAGWGGGGVGGQRPRGCVSMRVYERERRRGWGGGQETESLEAS